MNNRKLIIPAVVALAVVIIVPFSLHPADAHILKTFGNVSVKIGWLHEPPLVGDTNEIDVFVYKGLNDTAPPIADTGLDNMTVTEQYGGKSKVLTFSPSDDTPGLYTAALTPTQLGTFNTIIKGMINGTSIPATTYPMQDVESKDKYYFPPMSNNMTGMNMTNGTNPTVPEFGPIASIVLVFAIISAMIVTRKTSGFTKP